MVNIVGNKRGRESRSRLLEAGLAAFHTLGYTASGVDEITKAAGVPKGSFYNHFGSKEAFGAEVIDLYFERYLQQLERQLRDPQKKAIDRLRDYFEERIAFFDAAGFRRGCMLGNLSVEVGDHIETLRAHIARHFQAWSAMFAECLQQAIDDGSISRDLDVSSVADFVLNSWEGALLRMKAERSTLPLETCKNIIFGRVLNVK